MQMNASDGPHYGANVKLDKAGTYQLKLSIESVYNDHENDNNDKADSTCKNTCRNCFLTKLCSYNTGTKFFQFQSHDTNLNHAPDWSM